MSDEIETYVEQEQGGPPHIFHRCGRRRVVMHGDGTAWWPERDARGAWRPVGPKPFKAEDAAVQWVATGKRP